MAATSFSNALASIGRPGRTLTASWKNAAEGRTQAMSRTEGWPASLLLVRHAESLGNLAREAAEQSGAGFIDIAERDMDVDLSERGERQARAMGRWLAE